MKRKIIWLVVSCLMVATLVLASCGPAEVEEEEVVPPEEVEEEVVPEEVEEEVVTEEEEEAAPPVEEEEVAPPSLVATSEIKDFAFTPQTITVKKGTTISWSQHDSALHTVTTTSSPPGTEFDSGNLSQGETFDYTFTVVGTYEYFCRIHPFMTAKIVVSE